MKRTFYSLAALLLACSLTGCGEISPDKAADGADWDKDWTILGSTLGIEESNPKLTLQENPVVLTGKDTYYATWSMGEAVPYVNEDGDDTDLYDAQLYVLLVNNEELKSAAKEAADQEEQKIDPKDTIKEWVDHEKDIYEITKEDDEIINGQSYHLLSYRTLSETNPYEASLHLPSMVITA